MRTGRLWWRLVLMMDWRRAVATADRLLLEVELLVSHHAVDGCDELVSVLAAVGLQVQRPPLAHQIEKQLLSCPPCPSPLVLLPPA